MAQQKFTVKVSNKYDEQTRLAIGLEIIEHIIQRTQDGRDKNNKSLPGYSESYANSLDFKLAGKSKGDVNLTASGEMLNALTILNNKKGEITIGIPKDDDVNNAKAEGNIKGTYGGKPKRGKKRDFMGISRSDLKEITSEFAINNRENRDNTANRVLETLLATEAAQDIANNFLGDGFFDDEL